MEDQECAISSLNTWAIKCASVLVCVLLLLFLRPTSTKPQAEILKLNNVNGCIIIIIIMIISNIKLRVIWLRSVPIDVVQISHAIQMSLLH